MSDEWNWDEEAMARNAEEDAKNPFFTPLAEPIPSEYYHNVAGRDGIFTITMNSDAFKQGARAVEEQLKKALVGLGVNPEDLDPPSYLPMRERLPPRVPDLNPDDWQNEPCVCHEQSGPCRRCCKGVVPGDAPHDPETCRDPSCDCYPF